MINPKLTDSAEARIISLLRVEQVAFPYGCEYLADLRQFGEGSRCLQ